MYGAESRDKKYGKGRLEWHGHGAHTEESEAWWMNEGQTSKRGRATRESQVRAHFICPFH
jgi:hypothetical protein